MSDYRILSSEGRVEAERDTRRASVLTGRWRGILIWGGLALWILSLVIVARIGTIKTQAAGNSLAGKLIGYCETQAYIVVYTNTTNFVGSAVECGMDFIAIKSDSFGSSRRYIIPHEAIKVIQEMK